MLISEKNKLGHGSNTKHDNPNPSLRFKPKRGGLVYLIRLRIMDGNLCTLRLGANSTFFLLCK